MYYRIWVRGGGLHGNLDFVGGRISPRHFSDFERALGGRAEAEQRRACGHVMSQGVDVIRRVEGSMLMPFYPSGH